MKARRCNGKRNRPFEVLDAHRDVLSGEAVFTNSNAAQPVTCDS